jgi:cytidylate kinase|uniref:Cytidylate kinase-like family protein n=1 Tax=Desulfobacca acetoxidans TaxID=60893 RepID=A0A7V6A205_9BACT
MSIVTISRGSYSHGKEVAEKLAQRLGYACISREILLEASQHFNIPEIKLSRAIHDAPSILDRFTYGKERYIAYIREALMHHFIKDNVVYHGLAGQFFVVGVPHVLKVRILADINDRVAEEVKREGLSADKARALLLKDDEERYRWSNYLYGIDIRDPSLYDLVIHLRSLDIDEAVDLIYTTVRLPRFQTTPESQQAMATLMLAAQVQAALVEQIPSAKVGVEGDKIVVTIRGPWDDDKKLIAKVEEISDSVGGVKVKVRLVSP